MLSSGDLNIRGAFLHMAADAVVSLGVVLAGIAISITGWLWFDPVVSLIIVAVVVSGRGSYYETLNLALDAVPTGLSRLQSTRLSVQVCLKSTTYLGHETALTAHLVMPTGYPGDAFLCQVCKELHDHFGIEHSTSK